MPDTDDRRDELLDALDRQARTTAWLAKRIGVHPTTALRYLWALEDRGLVKRELGAIGATGGRFLWKRTGVDL